MKNPVIVGALILVGAGLLILTAIWFVHYWTRGRFVQSTNDAYIQADQVTVATRVSGFVDQVLVQDNQSVQAGQPLVRVDDRDPRAKMEQALAQVDQGRASVVQAQAQIRNFTKVVQRIPTRIRIDAGPQARKVLAPGLSATVSVDTYGAGADQ